jgi:hypothetical protein
MVTDRVFYFCLTCFAVSDSERECHGRRMVCCDPGEPGGDLRRPEMDDHGQLKSRAPRWFLRAVDALLVS